MKTLLDLWRDRPKIGQISLLDIGSALGFFLKAAQDLGISRVSGIEISKFAAEYCDKNFNIDVLNLSFEETNTEGSFDIITAWYFVEHSEYPAWIFRKIFDILNPGGIFAFSVPSSFGPLYIFRRAEWGNNFPVDHRICFSPISVKRLLKGIGFKKIKIKPGGIHPERIISKNSLFSKPFAVLYSKISKIFSFSDTIEVFAIKEF